MRAVRRLGRRSERPEKEAAAPAQLRLTDPEGLRTTTLVALEPRTRSTTTDHDDDSHAELALADVYRTHAGFVWRVLRSLGVPDEALDDLVHDVFLVVHRRLGEFDGRAAMTSWLYGIARGVAANHRRGSKRRQNHHRGLGSWLTLIQTSAQTKGSPTSVEAVDAADLVERFLGELDPAKREVFVLSELEGMSGVEIADALGIKVDTVYSRLRVVRTQ